MQQQSLVPINQLAQQVITSFAGKFEAKQIRIDADMESVNASVDRQAIHQAVSRMIENAIDSMPSGGKINLTLIDGPHHWELEVADSVGEIYGQQWKTEVDSNDAIHAENLKRIEPENPRLDAVRVAAQQHGGQVQSWLCPQGGTAHVLVIPRR